VEIARGVVIKHVEMRQKQTYLIRNEDTEARSVVLEHPVDAGWTLDAGTHPDETTAQWQRFKVPVAAKTTVNFVVGEFRPTESQYGVSAITDDELSLLVTDKLITPEVEAQLRKISAQKAEVARLADALASREAGISRISSDQERVRGNMAALHGTSQERQLLQRYVKELDEQETELATLRKEAAALGEAQRKAQADLEALIAALISG